MRKSELYIPYDEITVEDTTYQKLMSYLKKFRFKPNFWIQSGRRKMMVYAKWNGLVVGGAYVVTDNLTDNTWQVNCINGECENVIRKLISVVIDKALVSKRSVEFFHNKRTLGLMAEFGIVDTGKRMRRELV